MDNLVKELLKNIHTIPESEFVGKQQKREISARTSMLNFLQTQYAKKFKELKGYREEISKCIRGESNFDEAVLNELYIESKKDTESISQEITAVQENNKELTSKVDAFKKDYDKALTWAEICDTCSIEGKKMIIRQLIKKNQRF